MKRIINGVSFNTETSTEIAKYEFDDVDGGEQRTGFETLCQTRGGAFFTHSYQRMVTQDETAPGGQLSCLQICAIVDVSNCSLFQMEANLFVHLVIEALRVEQKKKTTKKLSKRLHRHLTSAAKWRAESRA